MDFGFEYLDISVLTFYIDNSEYALTAAADEILPHNRITC